MNSMSLGIVATICVLAIGAISAWTIIVEKNKKGEYQVTSIGFILLLLTGIAAICSWVSVTRGEAERKSQQIADSVRFSHDREKLENQLANMQNEMLKTFSLAWDSANHKWLNSPKSNVSITNNNRYESGTMCQIEAIITQTPNKSTQQLCNGEEIPLQYYAAPGSVRFTIPYMIDKDYAGGFTMNNTALTSVSFDKKTGTFDLSTAGVSGGLFDTHVSFTANTFVAESKVITVSTGGESVSATLYNDFFRYPITSISVYSQSYIIGADFTQDVNKRSITFTNGNMIEDKAKMVAYR